MSAVPSLLPVAIRSLGTCFPAVASKPVEAQSQPAKKVDNQKTDYPHMRMGLMMDRRGWGELELARWMPIRIHGQYEGINRPTNTLIHSETHS